VLWTDAGVHGNVFNNCLELLNGDPLQLDPGDDSRVLGLRAHNAQITGDVQCRIGVVPRDHHGADPRRSALVHCLAYLSPGRIDHAREPHKDELLLYGLLADPGGECVHGTECEAQHAHAIERHPVVGGHDATLPVRRHRLDASLAPHSVAHRDERIYGALAKGYIVGWR